VTHYIAWPPSLVQRVRLSSSRAMPLTKEVEEELRKVCDKTFAQFDADNSGEVSTTEIKEMMIGLGMLVKPETLAQMMKEADTDQSGEIDKEEFFNAMKKQAEGKGGGAFASLVNRSASSGPAMQWVTDKKGPGVTLGEGDDTRIVSYEGTGWGCLLLDRELRTGKSEDCYDRGDMLIKLDKIGGEMQIGLVGSNFKAGDWDQEPKGSSHTTAMNLADGSMSQRGRPLPTKACPVSAGNFVQVEVDMQTSSANIRVLSSDQEKVLAEVSVDQLHPSICLAIGFGAGTSKLTLMGASCEKTVGAAIRTEQAVSNEAQAAASNPEIAEAMSMAT